MQKPCDKRDKITILLNNTIRYDTHGSLEFEQRVTHDVLSVSIPLLPSSVVTLICAEDTVSLEDTKKRPVLKQERNAD